MAKTVRKWISDLFGRKKNTLPDESPTSFHDAFESAKPEWKRRESTILPIGESNRRRMAASNETRHPPPVVDAGSVHVQPGAQPAELVVVLNDQEFIETDFLSTSLIDVSDVELSDKLLSKYASPTIELVVEDSSNAVMHPDEEWFQLELTSDITDNNEKQNNNKQTQEHCNEIFQEQKITNQGIDTSTQESSKNPEVIYDEGRYIENKFYASFETNNENTQSDVENIAKIEIVFDKNNELACEMEFLFSVDEDDDWFDESIEVNIESNQFFGYERRFVESEGASQEKDWFEDLSLLEPSVEEEKEETEPSWSRGNLNEKTNSNNEKFLSIRDLKVGKVATGILDELPIFTLKQRRVGLVKIMQLLNEFPHHSSHSAIAKLATGGMTLDGILETAQLLNYWRERPHFWLYRRYDRSSCSWQIETHTNGDRSLAWAGAARLIRSFSLEGSIEAIEGEWRDRWLSLPVDHRFAATFISFIGAQVDLVETGDSRGLDERFDQRNWVMSLRPELRMAIRPDGMAPSPVSHTSIFTPTVPAGNDGGQEP